VAFRYRAPLLVLALAYALAGCFIVRPFFAATIATAPDRDVVAHSWRPLPHSTQVQPTYPPTATTPLATQPSVTATPTETVAPVTVLRTYPIDADGEIQPQAPLTIVFDQPMDTEPAACVVEIEPEVPLTMEWAAPNRLLLRGPGWEADTAYRFTLLQARSQSGGNLAQPLTLHFARGDRGAPIPILMYHHIDAYERTPDRDTAEWTVSPLQFAAEMDLLIRLGAHVVPLSEIVDYLEHAAPLPSRPVALTFDDGNHCILENAVPVLRERCLTATLFVFASYPGSVGAMSWDELRMLAEEGFEIGCHSYGHVKVHDLSPAAAAHEMGQARDLLERETGARVTLFAYPYGYFSDRAIAQLQAHGYRAAVTIDPTVYQRTDRLFTLGRIRTTYGEPLEGLLAELPWTE
jgi:peptidoglycan/xylan/chitin deacetylase (PgdA/CDA1 family)